MLLALVAVLGVALAGLAWAWLRPGGARVHPGLGIESWDVVADGLHNSNTDLLFWRDRFWLVHAASPWHLGSTRSRLVVRSSPDARTWTERARLALPGHDVRDPKLAVMGGRLHLYALKNSGTLATPEGTVLAVSEDGSSWSDFGAVGPEGWLFWRPKTRDGETWYVPAYWKEHGASILLRSGDGRRWERVSTIHEGDGNDETAVEFLPDGRLLATARLEVTPDTLLGHDEAGTLLAVAEPPYTEWKRRRTGAERLDGPVLFPHAGRVFAVARRQEGRGFLTRPGGVWSRKRTALYEVTPERLLVLSDLPSSGDTSYAGAVLRDGFLYSDYYTSDPRRDPPWLLGMFLPTDIRMARVPLAALVERADAATVGDGTP